VEDRVAQDSSVIVDSPAAPVFPVQTNGDTGAAPPSPNVGAPVAAPAASPGVVGHPASKTKTPASSPAVAPAAPAGAPAQ